jgi:hypothetical protein
MNDSDILPQLPDDVRRDLLCISLRYIVDGVEYFRVRRVLNR